MLTNSSALLMVAISALWSGEAAWARPGSRYKAVDSGPFEINSEMPHMRGPSQEVEFQLSSSRRKRLYWITEADVRRIEKKELKPDEYMCHTWLEQKGLSRPGSPLIRHSTFEQTSSTKGRLFTLSVNEASIRFPDGYGLPVESSQDLSFYFMVASAAKPAHPFQRVLRGKVEYLPDGPATKNFHALFRRSIFSVVPAAPGACHFGKTPELAEKLGIPCATGKYLPYMNIDDRLGVTYSGHWLAEPGNTVNTTVVTAMLNLPFDTTIHQIGTHIHPGVRRLILRDLTAAKDIFVTAVDRPAEDAGGRKPRQSGAHSHHHHVAPPLKGYSDPKGIEVFKDHEYALISEVSNEETTPIDIMTTLHIYLLDKQFRRIKHQASSPR